MTPAEIQALADAYSLMPRTGPLQHRAYRLLARYVAVRYVEAIKAGWKFVPDYTGAAPNLTRVRQTRVLPVFDAMHGHPELSDPENYMFRAVHDVIGHEMTEFGFAGELEAFADQALDLMLFGRGEGWSWAEQHLAESALFTETVGQAAYFEVHGDFPEQKAGLLLPLYDGGAKL